jgi:hypothetical protein
MSIRRNPERLNRWLTLAENLAVLAGILLVVVELGQNRDVIRAQTRSEVAAELVELLRDVRGNPQLADLLVRASQGGELTESEALQFQNSVVAMLRYFENVHYQYRQGLYAEDEFRPQVQLVAAGSGWCGYCASRPWKESTLSFRTTPSSMTIARRIVSFASQPSRPANTDGRWTISAAEIDLEALSQR